MTTPMDEMMENLIVRLHNERNDRGAMECSLHQLALVLADTRRMARGTAGNLIGALTARIARLENQEQARIYLAFSRIESLEGKHQGLMSRVGTLEGRHESVVATASRRLLAIETRLDGPQTKSPLDVMSHSVNERILELEAQAANHSLSNTVAGMTHRLAALESALKQEIATDGAIIDRMSKLENRLDAMRIATSTLKAADVDHDVCQVSSAFQQAAGWERKYLDMERQMIAERTRADHLATQNPVSASRYAEVVTERREIAALVDQLAGETLIEAVRRVCEERNAAQSLRNQIVELRAFNANQETTIKELRDSVFAHGLELIKTREEGTRAAAQRDRAIAALHAIEGGYVKVRDALSQWRKS